MALLLTALLEAEVQPAAAQVMLRLGERATQAHRDREDRAARAELREPQALGVRVVRVEPESCATPATLSVLAARRMRMCLKAARATRRAGRLSTLALQPNFAKTLLVQMRAVVRFRPATLGT